MAGRAGSARVSRWPAPPHSRTPSLSLSLSPPRTHAKRNARQSGSAACTASRSAACTAQRSMHSAAARPPGMATSTRPSSAAASLRISSSFLACRGGVEGRFSFLNIFLKSSKNKNKSNCFLHLPPRRHLGALWAALRWHVIFSAQPLTACWPPYAQPPTQPQPQPTVKTSRRCLERASQSCPASQLHPALQRKGALLPRTRKTKDKKKT